jgi:hypothetical protein
VSRLLCGRDARCSSGLVRDAHLFFIFAWQWMEVDVPVGLWEPKHDPPLGHYGALNGLRVCEWPGGNSRHH